MATAVYSALVHHHVDDLDRRSHLGVVAKRSYRLGVGMLGAGADAPLLLEPRVGEGVSFDSDLLCMQKHTTDVVLVGTAYAHRGPVEELTTSLSVGSGRKEVKVSGERRLLVNAGSVSATRAVPFESMKLGWQRAYGGRDRASETPVEKRGEPTVEDVLSHGANSYPRNRHGVGFFIDGDRARHHGALLPTQTDPADRSELDRLFARDAYDWLDRPAPAGYGPIDMITFPRAVFCGLEIEHAQPTRPVHEVSLGAFRLGDLARLDAGAGVDARAFNCAAPGLGNERLRGGERVELFNLHRGAERLVFELPRERPRLVVEAPNAGMFELEAKLGTVFIEPDEDRITLIWAGSTLAAGIYTPEACASMRHAAIWN